MMLDPKLAIAALTAATIGLYGSSAEAFTLFQDNLTGGRATYEKTWTSSVEAKVELGVSLSNIMDDLTASIWVDNEKVTDDNFNLINPNNPGTLDIGSQFEIAIGSKILFKVESQGEFDFSSSVSLLEETGLVFLGSGDGTFSHVGLNWKGDVYESSLPYTGGQYWDANLKDYRTINRDNGVQKEHSLGSFWHLSTDENRSPIQRYSYLPIPDSFNEGVAETMRNFIETKLHKTHPDPSQFVASISPYEQKCYGQQCTGVGLIERASEEAGIAGGEGFIPNYLEFRTFNNLYFGPTLEATPASCLTVFPLTPECKAFADRGGNGVKISFLTPAFQHYFLKYLNAQSDNWLQGWFYNVDFMLEDPQGNQLEYRDGTWAQTGDIPGVFYTTIGDERQFYIPQRLAGNYSLEFFGSCNPDAIAALADNQDGMLVSGCKEPDDDGGPNPTEQVPEPSTLLGLAILSFLGMRTRQKVRPS